LLTRLGSTAGRPKLTFTDAHAAVGYGPTMLMMLLPFVRGVAHTRVECVRANCGTRFCLDDDGGGCGLAE